MKTRRLRIKIVFKGWRILHPSHNAAFEFFALLHAAKNWHVPDGVWRYAGSTVNWRQIVAATKHEGK